MADDREKIVQKPSTQNGPAHDDGHDLRRQSTGARTIWASESLSMPREAFFVFVICMAQFCTQAAFMGTLVLLRIIGQTFNVTSPPHLAWLVAGYSLTVGTFIMFSGRLGDVFGYKRMLIVGFCWFSLWSLVAGLSVFSSFKLAVFARVIQGIGPAICLPNALAILGTAYPPGHRKAMVFAFFGAVAPIGGVCGGLFASLLTLAWWPIAIPQLPRKTVPTQGCKAWVRVLDLPGAFVGVVALILFNFAWTQAPIDGWATATVLVPLILGMLLFAAFIFIEARLSPMPLLPFDAVNAEVAFVLAAVVCGWATFGIWTLYLVQIMQDIRHLSPLLTTAWFSPVTVSGAVAAVVTGKLLGPLQVKPAAVMTLALLAFTVGAILTAFAPADQTYWGQIFVSICVTPWGMDMSFPAATLIVSNAVPKEHQGIGASLVNTVVNYGIALGVGFAGTVESHVHRGGLTSADRLVGFQGALYTGVGLAGLGLVVSLVFLCRETLISRRGHDGA
ncbi:major facilitator superfamily protein [Hirsutella rhossiliensis]|uniref:Major facilitator superfamily domain-containing protein n=1 Tax=Hirsutella rhossiliensis TaxID=111463 RepID=A0A9P8N7Z1_9HYPO|nr:major facilitator superfamily domain-containing protein [Hirsutella rhossiliensis]KAH0968500.1 major facilitator superfamily domain-containing protein [Hirsutella rhossiliensis]